MTYRGVLLTLAALCVVGFGAGSAFAFTPNILPLPDVIIGDQTPVDGLTPGDITTASDTIENIGPSANIFEFPNAFNLFNLVDDIPQNVSGFTSDENLVYVFTATPQAPGLGTPGVSDDRISINGTLVTTSGVTIPITTAADASLDFDDTEFSGDPDPLAVQGTLTYDFTNDTGTWTVNRDLIDANLINLRVTNNQGASAERDFFVYTVNDGPDSLSGGLAESIPVDLSGWTYDPQLSTPFGSFPGDTTVTGQIVPDDDGDGSVSDLDVTTVGTSGFSAVNFRSPADQIPFVADSTYRLNWTVSRTAFTGGTPTVRFRGGYGTVGTEGMGDFIAVQSGLTAPPTTTGRSYTVLFDQLDVASANSNVGSPAFPENYVTLYFETVDLNSTEGGGTIELDQLEIQRLETAAFVAGATDITPSTDLSSSSYARYPDLVSSTNGTITVVATSTEVSITAPASNGSNTLIPDGVFGGNLTVNQGGWGTVNIPVPASTGLFYRAVFDVDATGVAFTPGSGGSKIPQIGLELASFDGNGQRLTTQFNLRAARAGQATINPVLTAPGSFANYLAVPEGLNLGSNSGGTDPTNPGDAIRARLNVVDSSTEERGTILLQGITVQSLPESILP